MLRCALNAAISMDSGARQRMNYCWETPLSCEVKPLESRDACGREIMPIGTGHRPHQINRSGNPKMLHMRFGQANITRATHTEGTYSLANRSSDAFSQCILAGKCGR